MDFRNRASSNFSSNIVSESGSTNFVEDLVRATVRGPADDLLLDLGGAAEALTNNDSHCPLLGTEATSGRAARAAGDVLEAFGRAQDAIIEVANSTAEMIEKAGSAAARRTRPAGLLTRPALPAELHQRPTLSVGAEP